ncbi:threonine-phosphate decarboxylase CobD [Desulfuromonas carbonis]
MTLPPAQMAAADHGGGVARAARELGLPPEAVLDFSASINPLGMPPTVLAAAQASLPRAVHYPEIDAAALREALADHHGLRPSHLLPAAGSTELIYLLPRVLRPRRALLVRPAFSEYARSLAAADIPWDGFDLHPEDGFVLEPKRLLAALRPETELVLVANPGNPHGTGIDLQRLETVAAALRGQALLVVDEAFIDFCPDRSLLPRVAAHDNLYLLRSLTKFYAIPGLRAGFLAGPEKGVARLAAAREPWTLSTPALAAAEACLAAADFRRATARFLPPLRQALAAGLEALGLKVFPGAANFLLARLPATAPTATAVAASLYRQGILVRPCANFPPLDDRYLRFAVRPDEEQQRLVAALTPVLAAPGGGDP